MIEKVPSGVSLSIIIVTYNSSNCVTTCIHSLGNLPIGLTTETIVIDNASQDGSCEVVHREFPEVVCIRNDSNIGFVKANNQGCKLAKGQFVLFLNPDTEILGQALEEMVRYLIDHPEVGAVGPLLQNSDGSAQQSYFSFPGFLSIFIEYMVSSKLAARLELPRLIGLEPKEVDVIRGACLMSRKSVLDEIGGMNESLFMYSEETDLCYKIKKLGLSIVFLPGPRVIHYERKSMDTQSGFFTRYHYTRSRLIFIRDNYKTLRAFSLKGLIWASLVVKAFVYRLFLRHDKAEIFYSLVRRLKAESIW